MSGRDPVDDSPRPDPSDADPHGGDARAKATDAVKRPDASGEGTGKGPKANARNRLSHVWSAVSGWFSHAAAAIRWKADSVSLTTRLVAILLILLACGLIVAGFTTRQLVWSYMIDRTDEQLTRQAQSAVNNIKNLSVTSVGAPTDYYLQIRDSHNRILHTPLIPAMRDGTLSVPDLPRSGAKNTLKIGVPTTVRPVIATTPSTKLVASDTASWRVVALRWVGESTGESGILYIGLSLASALDTTIAISKYFVVVGLCVLAIAMLLGMVSISRAFAPLKRIEKAAAEIAGGDLTRRIPLAPPNTEIGSLSASLDTMMVQIERSFREEEETNAKMKQFVSDASHELRTPLAAIRGYAELYFMQRDEPGALQRADDTIEHIEKSSERMTLLVQDLLSLARLDEGRGIELNQSVSLDQLLRDSGEDLHALDPERPVRFGRLETATALEAGQSPREAFGRFEEGPLAAASVRGDAQRLRQVVTNIVGNLHRYTPADSPVEISLTHARACLSYPEAQKLKAVPASLDAFGKAMLEANQPAGTHGAGGRRPAKARDHGAPEVAPHRYVIVRVTDHGPGVPENTLGKLFERFYTADPSRAKARGGTGLGMAIAQSVVTAHSGFIAASKTPGGGLTLTVVLPDVRPGDDTAMKELEGGKKTRSAKQGSRSVR